jgi:excisionase family DNA binding protein
MEENNYMDVGMVSEYLHVKKSTIYSWTSNNLIPYKKLAGGKRTIYVKDEIDQWVRNSGNPSIDLPQLPNY